MAHRITSSETRDRSTPIMAGRPGELGEDVAGGGAVDRVVRRPSRSPGPPRRPPGPGPARSRRGRRSRRARPPRACPSRPAARTSRSSAQAWASRWWLSSTGWACCRWVRPGMATPRWALAWSDQRVDRGEHAAGDDPGVVAQEHPAQRWRPGRCGTGRRGACRRAGCRRARSGRVPASRARPRRIGRRCTRRRRRPRPAGPGRPACRRARRRPAARPCAARGRAPGTRQCRSGPAASRSAWTCSARRGRPRGRRRTGRPTAHPVFVALRTWWSPTAATRATFLRRGCRGRRQPWRTCPTAR